MENTYELTAGAKQVPALKAARTRRTPQKHGLTRLLKSRYPSHARQLDEESAGIV